MAIFRPKLWLGLTATLAGSAAFALASSQVHAADAHVDGSFQLAASGAEGGEGGEGGERGHSQTVDPLAGAQADEALAARLILMKGHLEVGHELYLAGLVKDAEPHMTHPSTEIYGRIKPELKAQGVPGFHDKLDAVRLAFEAKATGPNFEKPYAEAIAAIDQAIGVLNAKASPPPASGRLAYLVLGVAASEYTAAFDKDGEKITAAVEYQDALGFYRQARALVEANAAAFKKRDAKAYSQVLAHFDALKVTWPSAAVPREPVTSPSRFQSEVLTLTGLLKGFE